MELVRDPANTNKSTKADPATAVLYEPWNGGQSPFDERTALDRTWSRLSKLHPMEPHTLRNVVVTLFGCNGFMGQALIRALQKRGAKVICPIRRWHERTAAAPPVWLTRDNASAKTMLCVYDPSSFDEIVSLVHRSHIVINCIGRKRQPSTFRGDLNMGYEAVYCNLPRMIARASAMCNVDRFIHISHVNADPNHWSRALKYKGMGEEAVRDEFPGATIIRPTDVFGIQDGFLRCIMDCAQRGNKIPVPFPDKLVQPLFMMDIAWGVMKAATLRHTTGRTIELGGPRQYTYTELIDFLQRRMLRYKSAQVIDYVPFFWKGWRIPEFYEDELYNHTVVHEGAHSWEQFDVDERDLWSMHENMQWLTLATSDHAQYWYRWDKHFLP
eukprot:TRINITY_DN35893_c0_g1_i1.p1 TRINITY_DN35893_c0_g1~~TRINITY_DN35893_c0_g1_i1.p1  ORF type:complete len:419 (-),score=8.96 TRINITY_DN35893_c0_g1_i1:943-2094(-)